MFFVVSLFLVGNAGLFGGLANCQVDDDEALAKEMNEMEA